MFERQEVDSLVAHQAVVLLFRVRIFNFQPKVDSQILCGVYPRNTKNTTGSGNIHQTFPITIYTWLGNRLCRISSDFLRHKNTYEFRKGTETHLEYKKGTEMKKLKEGEATEWSRKKIRKSAK
jgi:hypothetical protein